MVLTGEAGTRAARMGDRAGALFRDHGIPTRNPFTVTTRPDLALAWRAAYFAALGTASTSPRLDAAGTTDPGSTSGEQEQHP